ncbi:MAG: primosomal protein N' [Desulfobacteraceae bacterium]|nr:primosomal protein N' [Desulfobacteraceae bacterium]
MYWFPKFALISQTERRFRARFGECVAVLHSGLTPKERRIQWQKIVRKEVSIAVGPRSAVFSPFDNIGLIIVDEEHDGSYKQENDLLYNARDIALVRAKFCECPALLGSATPSVQTYYNACIGKLTELKLNSRVEERPMPRIHIADLRKIRDFRGIRRFITPELHQKMSKALSEGNQILLFLNRRGFAAFPVCAECGASLRCEHCDISMTLHKSDNAYKCHFCGFTRSSKSLCPTCGSANIKFLGLGTERVEESVRILFPEARIARMDRDTTSKKGALLDILKDLKHQKIDILIGTQMVAKGHDFPKITLVGIICADLTLNLPDFRAGEQTFQLPGSGCRKSRAGRSARAGNFADLRTESFYSAFRAGQDFRLFYDREIESRRALQYPPFSRLIQIRISGQDSEKVQEFAASLGSLSKEIRKSNTSFQVITVLGPAESPISRIEGKYRWQMLLKSTSSKLLHDFCRQVMAKKTGLAHHREIRMTADVDPLFMA